MHTTGAIQHAPQKIFNYHPCEHPLAIQLGGSNPDELAISAKKAEMAGFDEVNFNLGCPSDRVQAGRFGACLMKEPTLAAKCVQAMKDAVHIPVSVKTRIGVDKQDSYTFFSDFISVLVDAGADKLIVHARKAWLKGLNPKQNRSIPPIHYEFVYQIKKELSIPVVINGHVNSFDEVKSHLDIVDGVMIGRLACQNPYEIAKIHHKIYSDGPIISRVDAALAYHAYLINLIDKAPLSLLIKPILGMSHGLAGGKKWKNDILEAQRQGRIESLYEIIIKLATMTPVVNVPDLA
tara:strand:- start:1002 stop:1877 length:876 start_codon:yes stop_codon:yes gene_type:complete